MSRIINEQINGQIRDLEDKPKDMSQDMIQKTRKYEISEGKWDRRWRKSSIRQMEVLQGKKTDKGGKSEKHLGKKKVPKFKNEYFQSEGAHRMPGQQEYNKTQN